MSQASYKYSRLKSACDTIHYQLSTLNYQLLSRPCRALGKWGSSRSGGCASLHRRLCISHP
ncbi:MAG: hypothetical protein LBE12_08385 [Planctomycetaceae bacterium]|nr:hypothetical protein [Planctomycetaceae bacterium]